MPDDLLTPPEVMALLKVSRQTLFRWRQDGTLDAVRIGRLVRYRREDVDALYSPAPSEPSETVA